MTQADFFQTPAQTEMFEAAPAPGRLKVDPDRVRQKLHHILTEIKAAETLPWDAQRLRYLRTVVPQMSLWLPEEEAAQLRFEFEQEVKRLEAA